MKTKFEHHFFIDRKQPVLQGHFPGHPILPGIMLLNFAKTSLSRELNKPCRIKKIIRHKFIKPVLPDFNIRVECTMTGSGQAQFFPVECKVFDELDNLLASGQYQIELMS